jgi:hypothetical protein
MRWHALLEAGVVVLSLTAAGCADRSLALAVEPELLERISAAGGGDASSVARAQKPDVKQASLSTLDVVPERSTEASQGRAVNLIRATVNNQAILDSEVKAASYQALLATRSMNLPPEERGRREVEIYKAALDQLIEREVILQDAIARLTKGPGGNQVLKKLEDIASREFDKRWVRAMKEGNGIKSDEEFKSFLKSQGLELAMVKRQWERNFMATEYLRNRVGGSVDRIGHGQMIEYYEKHPEEFKVDDAVEWQEIFIHNTLRHPSREAARRFAEVLAGRVRNGEDFVSLSKQFDDGESALRGGAGLGHKRGEISPREAEPVLFAMKDGEVRVLDQENGFRVMRLLKRTRSGLQPFDEKVQRDIRDKLRNEAAQREIKKLVTDLKRKAIIEYATRVN